MIERAKKGSCCNKYAAILMDINMPVMDGIEATQILKRLMKCEEVEFTPIIAVSTTHCGTPEEKQRFFNLGFDEFLEKPVTTEKLKGMLSKFNVLL